MKKSSSNTKELHMGRRDISRYKDSKRAADSIRAKAESELVVSRKTVVELSGKIEESNSKAKVKMRDIEALKKGGGGREDDADNSQYEEVMRELEFVKQELSKLKLKMASVSQEKAQAEKKIEESSMKLSTNTVSVDALRKEIDAANEEQVLVELAQIEAMKELGEIEAQRAKEAIEMEYTKKKLKEASEEFEQSKELEHKLAVTLEDVTVLQNELNLVKEMDERVQRSDDNEGLNDSPSLLSIRKELEAAKKELALLREECFQFMASMDVIRKELNHVTEEITRLKKTEEKTDMKVQSLNSKLLRAKTKLEAVTAAEEKATLIVNNLGLTLKQLKTDAEASKKQKALVVEESTRIKAEIKKTESEIDLAEEKLQAAMQELEAIKSSEALALQNLTGRAVGAEEIADKKIAAAQAWVEALKASEREILMKSFARKPFKGSENSNSTPSRRGKFPKSASPAWRKGRSTPILIKKKKTVMPNLARFFGTKKIED